MFDRKKNFYIESLGCCSNQVDSNRIRNFFITNGWREVKEITPASVIILMTCAVTTITEDYNIDKLLELTKNKNNNAEIIVGGCLPAINKKRLSSIFKGVSFTPRSLHKLNDYANFGEKIESISPTMVESEKHSLKTIRISTGCLGSCSYCAIVFANGRTKSRNPHAILEDIEEAIGQGFQKIKLVSEDIGAYGIDIGLSIVHLVKTIAEHHGRYQIYLDTFNPNWFYHYRNDLVDILEDNKFIKRFCVPIQSGSNRILTLMKRGYTVEQFKSLFYLLYDTFDNVEISTDFIVGFPTETPEDFEATLDILNQFKFNHIQIFTFEERPNTNAVKLEPKVPEEIKEKRRQELFMAYMEQFIIQNDINDKKSLKSKLDAINCFPVNFNLILPQKGGK